MNSDFPTDPPQELEARLSALILGQLSEEQAAELQQQLHQDPELLKLYHRLQSATELIREAAVTADPAKSRGPVPRLSQQRREQLLASFKTITPDARARSRWSFKSWAVPAAAAAMILVLGAGLLSSLSKAKFKSQSFAALGRRLANTESEQAAAGRYRLAESLDAASAVTAPLGATEQMVTEARGMAPDSGAIAKGAKRPVSGGTKGGGMGGFGDATRNSEELARQPRGGAVGLAEGAGLAGATPPKPLFFSPGGAVIEGKDESAPAQQSKTWNLSAARRGFYDYNKVASDVTAEPAASLPVASTAVPAVPHPTKEQLPGEKLWSYQVQAEAKAELGKKTSLLSGTEVAQEGGSIVAEGLQLATNAFANRSSGASWGNYDNNSGGFLFLAGNANTYTPNGRKLAETSADSLGYGVALKDDSGKVLNQQLDSYFAKELPVDAKQATVDSLARYARRGDAAERSDKNPTSTVTRNEVQAAQSAGELKGRPASGRDEIQVGKAAQLAAATEEKTKALGVEENLSLADQQTDLPAVRPALLAPVPQPEILTRQNRFSTFSLNVSDVSFKLAAAALEKGVLPDAGTIRSEEFINAFNYHDPEPAPGSPLAFAWEIARSPFAHNRDLIRFSVKTAAQGRQQGRPLNIVVLLDNSGSMERADRSRIVRKAFQMLATQLQAQDRLSIVLFARTAQLWVDGVPGDQAASLAEGISNLVPQGGTNLEEAMNLAYQTALRHYSASGINRVVLLTDGAANLGDVEPTALKEKVESFRKQGIALDCFGVGWEGYNDELMETLSRNGDGRYGFINTPEEADSGFVSQLAGALQVAASDVKVQVEFNPDRVNFYRQIGYAKHQLTKEQFRDNTVDAAEIGATESGNAMYSIEVNPSGLGPIATLRVRYKVPGTSEYKELEWMVPFNGNSPALEQASPAMKLAVTASTFSEWLASNPSTGDVTTAGLLKAFEGVPQAFPSDARAKQLEWMIRQAQSLSGK